jgi:cation diffusion facilitator CzcD-associated flavoprotein CzcO/acetyl esterase/lipase
MSSAPSPVPHVRVAIIGSGFGGLGTAIRLKQEGENDFLVFERAAQVGGVWRDNSYPGCACDVQSNLYSFSFAQNPEWTRSYPQQSEIWAYLETCADRFGIRPHLRLLHTVNRASWDDTLQQWTLETNKGTFTASVLVGAVGALSEPGIPDIPGLKSFKGKTFHSARWDHAYALEGKSVAVVGTGASAIQFVPAIQPKVKKLTLFQRTAPWVMPRRDRAFRPLERTLFAKAPFFQRLLRGTIYGTRELTALVFFYPELGRLAQKLAERHLARSVKDAELHAKLTPSFTLGCKRVLLSDDYYPAVTAPNVEVVPSAVTRVTEDGVVGADGQEHKVDAILFGTGFQIQDYPFGKLIRGRNGLLLSDAWKDTMTAHLGTTVSGFPNLFLIQGPNTGLGHTSVIYMIEAQVEHIVHALGHMKRVGATSIEPTVEAQKAFVEKIDHDMKGTVWTAGGCQSWYLDRMGRNSTLWPGFTFNFARRVAPFAAGEYAVKKAWERPAVRHAAVAESVAFSVASGLGKLPGFVRDAIAGKAKVERDGYVLDQDLKLILAVNAKLEAPRSQDPLRIRRERDRSATSTRGPRPNVHGVREFVINGATGPLKARLYQADKAGAPLLVYFHGGGFVFGNLETHDVGCRILCREGALNVLSVEYGLVPEHRFPEPIHDAQAALAWAHDQAAELGADPARIGVGGDSAGGNLSAVVSLLEKGSKIRPAFQLLVYPATDRTREHPSMTSLAEGFLLTREAVEWFHIQYAASVGADSKDPRISPLLAKDLSGLPPALVVTAGFDPLRDEGEAYAAALTKAGTKAKLLRFDGLIHGFFNLTGLHPASEKAVIEIGWAMKALVTALPAKTAPRAQARNGDGRASAAR